MNRQRIHGSDHELLAWCRAHHEQLPSYSMRCGVVVTDVDAIFHRYLSDVQDEQGTRDLQAMMIVEGKTRGADLTDSQRDTFFKQHLCTKNCEVDGQTVHHFGVSLLFLSGKTPDDSKKIIWGRFDGCAEKTKRRAITLDQLFKLLRFELHPHNFDPRPFRRHHKTKEIVQIRNNGLFHDEITIVKRS